MSRVRAMDDLTDYRDSEFTTVRASVDRDKAGQILRNGLKQLDIVLDDGALDHCLDHADTLVSWNRIHNLSAIREMKGILFKHFLDSFSILRFVKGSNVIDVGSGAGFPGIPIALAKPDFQIVLLDSNMKKTEFLRHSVARMGMKNVEVVCERVQDLAKKDRKFDTVISRAMGSINAIAEYGLPILSSRGRILAMKGKHPGRELGGLEMQCDASVHELVVPGLGAERHLVVLKRKS